MGARERKTKKSLIDDPGEEEKYTPETDSVRCTAEVSTGFFFPRGEGERRRVISSDASRQDGASLPLLFFPRANPTRGFSFSDGNGGCQLRRHCVAFFFVGTVLGRSLLLPHAAAIYSTVPTYDYSLRQSPPGGKWFEEDEEGYFGHYPPPPLSAH